MAVILFFGRLSELSAPLDIDLPKDIKTVDGLIIWLEENYPALKSGLKHKGNRIAVNHEIVDLKSLVSNKDEIAFMSPLSGG